MLEELLPIDIAVADRLLSAVNCDSEEARQFLYSLSRAYREGHLCIKIEKECLPRELITDCTADPNLYPSTPLCRSGDLIYFQKSWLDECLFKENLKRLLKDTPEIKVEISKCFSDLLPEQKDAIMKALQNSFTIISGGPGTGKTYTAGLLIKTLWESLTELQKGCINIALAAPTGKAASNLQKSIQKALKNVSDFPPLNAQTLHSILGKVPTHLKYDLILIDECSMIDARIMSELLSSVKCGARLIFLGDPHQLPPVESGALFGDMTALLPNHSVELKKCLRSDLKNILDFASKVNEGDAKAALELLSTSREESGLKKIGEDDLSPGRTKRFILEYASKKFPLPYFSDETPESLINRFNQFRILSPMRRGLFGVDELNVLFRDHFRSRVPFGSSFVAPVMITSNDYRLELFNGETGILVRPEREKEYLLLQGSSGIRKIPGILLPRYEFAYCLSVHKSQGSEFDEVLALFPEGSEVFGREVLYTAATRARKLLEVWGKNEILYQLINKKVRRISGLRSSSCLLD